MLTQGHPRRRSTRRCVIGVATSGWLSGCVTFDDPSREFRPPVEGTALHAVVTETPQTLGVVDSPLRDVNGTPLGVRCVTCHGPDPEASWAATPGEPFHTG